MRHVTQRNHCGCAPAAVAMLTGKSYRCCRSLFHGKKEWQKRGTSVKGVERVLRDSGISTTRRQHLRASRDALVVVNDRQLKPRIWGGRHAIVWDSANQRFLDPDVGRRGRTRHLPEGVYLDCIEVVVQINPRKG